MRIILFIFFGFVRGKEVFLERELSISVAQTCAGVVYQTLEAQVLYLYFQKISDGFF